MKRFMSVNVVGILAVLMILLGFPSTGTSGDQTMINLFGSTNFDTSYKVASDGSGNIYTAGDINGVSGKQATTQNGFLRKTDATGTVLWTIQIGIDGAYDEIRGLSVASDGTAWVVGSTLGSINVANAGDRDLFVAKVTAAGSIEWLAQLGTAYEDYAQSVVVDYNGNAYVSGWTMGSLDGVTAYNKYRYGLIMKFDTNGQRLWTAQFNTATRALNNFTYGIAIYGSNVYVTGSTVANAAGNLFLVVYNTDGTFQWKRNMGGENTYGKAVVVNSSGIYITGFTISAFDGNAYLGGYRNAILVKFDLAGTKQWSRLWGMGYWDEGCDIAVDSENSIYVAGNTKGNLHGETAIGGYDAYVSKYYDDGTREYTKLVGTASTDYANTVAVDPVDNVLLAGTTYGNFTGQTKVGGYDAFTSARISDTDAAIATVKVTEVASAAALSEVLATVDYSADGTASAAATIEQASTDDSGIFKIRSHAGKHFVYKEKKGYKSVNIPDQLTIQKGFNNTVQVVNMKKDTPSWTIYKSVGHNGHHGHHDMFKQGTVSTPPIDCSVDWLQQQAKKIHAQLTVYAINSNDKHHIFDLFHRGHSRSLSGSTILKAGTSYVFIINKDLTITNWTDCTSVLAKVKKIENKKEDKKCKDIKVAKK